MPKAKVLKPEMFATTPWRNGRGQSHEIARAPVAGEDFLWRLSRAPIAEPGPFSAYPGFHRWLTVMEGAELRLCFEQKPAPVNLRPGDVYLFSGDEAVTAELPKGPVADLGLVFDPKRVRAEMSVVEFFGRGRSFRLSSRLVFFFAARGVFDFGCYPGGPEGRLEEGSALRSAEAEPASGERLVTFEPRRNNGALVAVELDW